MKWPVDQLTMLPTALLLVCMALVTALLAVIVAWGARLVVRSACRSCGSAWHGGRRGNGSLLAFIVFVLAHVLIDVRANLGHADDQ
jgi:hypothetical protein